MQCLRAHGPRGILKLLHHSTGGTQKEETCSSPFLSPLSGEAVLQLFQGSRAALPAPEVCLQLSPHLVVWLEPQTLGSGLVWAVLGLRSLDSGFIALVP